MDLRSYLRELWHSGVGLDNVGSELRRRYPYLGFFVDMREFRSWPDYGPNVLGTAATVVPSIESGEYRKILEQLGEKPGPRKQKALYKERLAQVADLLQWGLLYVPKSRLIVDYKGSRQSVPCIPGHRWGAKEHGPVPGDPVEVLIVGQHPGIEEEDAGYNFVGPSGEFLDEVLRKLGRDEDEVSSWYVTNIVRFRPDHVPNRPSSLPAAWASDFLPLLYQEIALLQPDVVWLMGREAIGAVLGRKESIRSTRGRVFELKLADLGMSVPVVTSRHPAESLRNPDRVSDFEASVRAALDHIDAIAGRKSSTISIPPAGESGNYIVIEDAQALRSWVDERLAAGDLEYSVDLEWEGNWPADPGSYIRTIQTSWQEGSAAIIVVRKQGGNPLPGLDDDTIRSELERLWRRPEVRLIGHYFISDLAWLCHYGMEWMVDQFETSDSPESTDRQGGFDTLLAAHAVCETDDFDLEGLCAKYLSLPSYKFVMDQWRDQYKARTGNKPLGYGEAEDEVLYPYAANDVDYPLRLYRYLNDKLDDDGGGRNCRRAFWYQMRALPAFLEAHMTGMPVDVEAADKLYQCYYEAAQAILWKLRDMVGWPDFNPNSTDDACELFFGDAYLEKDPATGEPKRRRPAGARTLNAKPYKTTKGDLWSRIRGTLEEENARPSVDKEVVSQLSLHWEEARLFQQYRTLNHVITYVIKPPLRDNYGQVVRNQSGLPVYSGGYLAHLRSDGRIHTMYSQDKETGRASSWSPNMQNLGKSVEAKYQAILGDRYSMPIRSIFVAPKGWYIVEADYSQAEVAVTAWLSQDPMLLDHVARSRLDPSDPDYYDIHSQTAVRSFGLSCPPTKEGLASIGKSHLRRSAKNRFFGKLYSQSDESAYRTMIEDGIFVDFEDVKRVSRDLDRTYKEVWRFFKRASDRVINPGWVCNPFGVYRRFPSRIEDRGVLASLQRQAGNFLIQGSVASVVKEAMHHAYMERRSRGMRFRMSQQIHDSLAFLVPEEELEEVCTEIIPMCMIERVPFYPADMDGKRMDGVGPYYFSIEVEISERWGCPIKELNERFGGEKSLHPVQP